MKIPAKLNHRKILEKMSYLRNVFLVNDHNQTQLFLSFYPFMSKIA